MPSRRAIVAMSFGALAGVCAARKLYILVCRSKRQRVQCAGSLTVRESRSLEIQSHAVCEFVGADELPDGDEASLAEDDKEDGEEDGEEDKEDGGSHPQGLALHLFLRDVNMACNSTFNSAFEVVSAPSADSLVASMYTLQVAVEAKENWIDVKPALEVGDNDLGTADQVSKSPRSAALVGSGPLSSRQSAVPAPEHLAVIRPVDGTAKHRQQGLLRAKSHRRCSLPSVLPSEAAVSPRSLRAAPDRCSSGGGCSSSGSVQLVTPVQPGGDNNATASTAAPMQWERQQEEKADQVEEQRPVEQEERQDGLCAGQGVEAGPLPEADKAEAEAVRLVEEQAYSRLVQLRAQPQARWVAPASKPVVHKLPTQRAETQGQQAVALVSKEGRRQQVQPQQSEQRRQRQPPHQELQRQRRQADVEVGGAQAVQPRWR